MNKLAKILVGMVSVSFAFVLFTTPVKADLASDKAWVEAQAAAGMAQGLAHQQEIAAQAAAGMASGQAYLQDIAAKTAVAAAAVQAQAAAGMH